MRVSLRPPSKYRHHVNMETHQKSVVTPRIPPHCHGTSADASAALLTSSSLTAIQSELKETHLGPLSAFSRSPSTSTITEKDDKGQPSPGATTPTTESAIGKWAPLEYLIFLCLYSQI